MVSRRTRRLLRFVPGAALTVVAFAIAKPGPDHVSPWVMLVALGALFWAAEGR